ncbi:MAG: phosphoribosylformylglycinamidine synthase subunit PurL [Chloroflexi bacterium HGW-Chloroflexi-6]|nr:MAG: phosphoribosylformylglycinamidine synthase subunit PurL [Chloroflexi bacterium HGW-Chloroflexi-6]
MSTYRFVITFTDHDPRSAGFLSDAHALGFHDLRRIKCQDLYFIEGQLSQDEAQQLALKLLSDPVTQSCQLSKVESPAAEFHSTPDVVEVAYRPGVTDPVAEQIVRAARELGFDGVKRAATGLRFQAEGLSVPQVEKLAKQLLANNVIQHWKIGEIAPSFPEEAASSGEVEMIPVRDLSDADLLSVSQNRRAALDLAEMQAVRAYFQREGREPTDVEIEMIAQTWSEHCVHKTFKARLEITDESKESGLEVSILDSLIRTYLKAATDKIAAPWVISAFVDNAGIIDFDDEFEISFKAETHNHPSAIEPFGGANTGVGGVIRDVLGVSAKPIANTDVLCFGPQDMNPDLLPDGVLHPRRIQNGVVAGVQDYGNKIGIPTVNGAILYDEGYTANPLVFCGCVGIAPKGKHHKDPRPGDRVIVLGGRTGRDGLRGATFSSMTMDAQTGEVSGASVQIGDPITEKGLIDVIVRARDLALYTDITDCGAGGLSSAVGEMTSVIGGDVELTEVRLKYPGLAPWEIWLSEAQERMVLAVPPENIPALQELCDTFDTELTDIGAFTGDGRIIVRYEGKVVLDLENEFLHEGIPQRQLKAVIREEKGEMRDEKKALTPSLISSHLLSHLSSPNIASKAATIRIYDHEVQGGTVVKPLTGLEADAPSDAAVLKPIGTRGKKGIVLSNGINPEYGKRDAYKMALSVIDEAIRNAVAVGANPERIAILDNFCWGDPLRPETLGTLVEACRGCHDGALLFGTPFISGKDSLNNEYLGNDGQRHSIPPTLLISAIGIIDDVNLAITMDLKEAGNALYLVGQLSDANVLVPEVPASAPAVYRALHQAIQNGLVKSCHDLSEGGLAVAAAEMCIGGRLGLELIGSLQADACFAETNGCLLAEIAPAAEAEFEKRFAGLPLTKIGTVLSEPLLKLAGAEIAVSDLVKAFNRTMESKVS